ncbi:MAG: hypothetical protein U5N10_01355 [Gemmobacter sp.]|nr:hypothetical protein [Gemmobacter sp.]
MADCPMLAHDAARRADHPGAHPLNWPQGPGVTILCGRFEGFDERLFEARDIEEVSIGDYILSGGEMGALVLLDACIRLLPGVMGAASSGDEESFETGLLEYPHYTRPQDWEGRTIPEVLRSGDHAKIAAWRKQQGGGSIHGYADRTFGSAIRALGSSLPSGAQRRTRTRSMNLIQTDRSRRTSPNPANKKIPISAPAIR